MVLVLILSSFFRHRHGDDGMRAINRDDGSIAFSAWALQYSMLQWGYSM
jgi:hypothetical protein